MLAALAVMVIGYVGVFFGRLIQAAVSRQREFLADASAVQFTRNPGGSVRRSAQDRGRQRRLAHRHAGSREVAHMLFAAGLPRLFATHPPLAERIRRSTRRSGQDLPTLAAEATRDCALRQRQADAVRPRGVRAAAASAGAFARRGGSASLAIRRRRSRRWPAPSRPTARVSPRTRACAIPEALRAFVVSADHARALRWCCW